MNNKNNTSGQGNPNELYYQEMKKLKLERKEWLKKHNVQSEKEWYEKIYLPGLNA